MIIKDDFPLLGVKVKKKKKKKKSMFIISTIIVYIIPMLGYNKRSLPHALVHEIGLKLGSLTWV